MNIQEALKNNQRLLIDANLAPVQGDRFQPTGFADIGHAVYRTPSGVRKLLVESSQSMANRMEAVCLQGQGPCIRPELDGLPYVLADFTGDSDVQTSSLVEAHRLNSPFIITDKDLREDFTQRAEYKKGAFLNWSKIAAAFMYYDPCSLLHGAFMANLEDGRVKVPRALTAFIEAENVEEAASGGVKNNPFDPTGKLRAKDYDKDVYGNVPYHRMEYTAEKVTAYFNLDLGLLRSYQLPTEAESLLVQLSLFKIQSFLEGGLRLRTACDFRLESALLVREPENLGIPSASDLLRTIGESIQICKQAGVLGESPYRVTCETVQKASKE